MKTNDELIEEFVTAYCVKRPAQPIRWIRSIFYDEEEQIQTILDFMSNLLTQKDAEVAEAFKKGEQSILNNTTVGWDIDIVQLDGTICKWRLINIYDVIPPHPTEGTSGKTK